MLIEPQKRLRKIWYRLNKNQSTKKVDFFGIWRVLKQNCDKARTRDTEVAVHGGSEEKVFWKYAANV